MSEQIHYGDSVPAGIIEIMVHHYVSPAEYDRPDAPFFREVTAWAQANDLLKPRDPKQEHDGGYTPSRFVITERGSAWVEMMRATPLPVSAFIDPRTGEKVPS